MKIPGTAFLLLLFACQNAGNGNSRPTDTTTASASAVAPIARPSPDTTSLSGRWYLQPILPSDTAAGKTPWLDLDPDHSRFTGNSGCNSMHGKFYFSKNDSSFSFNNEIATGRMACPGYNEPAFLKSLKNTARFKLHNGMLMFLGEDRTELSHWIRQPAKAPKALKT